MPLRVLRAVHQQPTHRTLQLLPPHPTYLFIAPRRDRHHPTHRPLQPLRELHKRSLPPRLILHLRPQSLHLRSTQLLPLRIRQQPIERPHNMPQLKPHRRQPQRPRLHLLLRQPLTPPRDILPRQLQRMQHLPPHRIHLRQRPPQPRLYHIALPLISLYPSDHRYAYPSHPRQSAVEPQSPFPRRNSLTTSPTSLCCPSTASFIPRTSSADTLPASRSLAPWIPGCRRNESSRTSGTASYGGK